MKRAALLLISLLVGCRREMYDQPRADALKSSDLFANGAASQPLPAHTVPQENYHSNLWYDTGRIGTNPVTELPFVTTRAILEHGRDCYNTYCSMCHGQTGSGNGIVVQRGFPHPSDMAIDRLRAEPPGYFVDVITRGYGVMYSYANRVAPDDRWAIASYIRVLQLSRHATLADVPESERARLENVSR